MNNSIEIQNIIKYKLLDYYDNIVQRPCTNYYCVNNVTYYYGGISVIGENTHNKKIMPINFGLYGKMLDISLDESLVYHTKALNSFFYNIFSSSTMIRAVNEGLIVLQVRTEQSLRPNIALHNMVSEILTSLSVDISKAKIQCYAA